MALSTLKATSPVPPATSRCRMPANGCSFATSLRFDGSMLPSADNRVSLSSSNWPVKTCCYIARQFLTVSTAVSDVVDKQGAD